MLTTLLDRSTAPPLPWPDELRERYGGPLGFAAPPDRPLVVANFVTTIDGVTSYRAHGQGQSALISGKNPDDRFVMGLLRASVDAVVVGAGTLRDEPRALWTAPFIFPSAAPAYAELRRALGKPPLPTIVFVTASGAVDLDARAFREPEIPTLVLTTSAGAARLGAAPRHVTVRAIETNGRPSARAVLAATAESTGARLVLTEGGPQLLGTFLAEGMLDELFLTVAPQIGGRDAAQPRLALVEGKAFAPDAAPWGRLVSVKAAGEFLFLRYALR